MDYPNEYDGSALFMGVDGNYLITVGDVDKDGDIDQDDALAITSYYVSYIVLGLSGYNGPIGSTTGMIVAGYVSY